MNLTAVQEEPIAFSSVNWLKKKVQTHLRGGGACREVPKGATPLGAQHHLPLLLLAQHSFHTLPPSKEIQGIGLL